jgi:hypothetical protein
MMEFRDIVNDNLVEPVIARSADQGRDDEAISFI